MQNLENKSPKYIIGLVVFAIILALLNLIPLGAQIKDAVNTVYSPLSFWGAKWGGSFSYSIKLIPDISSLTQDNSDLRARIVELETKLADYNLLSEKYENLVNHTKLASKKFSYIEAEVVKVNNFLIANVGSDDGVKKDSIVVHGNSYVGVVSQVDKSSCKIELPISMASSIEVIITNPGKVVTSSSGGIYSKGRISGVLIGKGETFEVENILSGSKILLDDLIVSSEEGLGYLVIGKVIEINLDQAASVFSLKAIPIVDYAELKYVYIRK